MVGKVVVNSPQSQETCLFEITHLLVCVEQARVWIPSFLDGPYPKNLLKGTDMKKLLFIFLLMCMAFFIFANGKSEIESPSIIKGITIIDTFDRTVTIKNPAQRVVYIAPSVSETIFALGMGKVLVGRTDYCDYPEESLNITSIGLLDIALSAGLK
jgi:hypothetical protein